MLRSLRIQGFKSLVDTDLIEFAPITLFFGPNAAGKSNLIDALHVLSRLAGANTLAEALGPPMRGLPIEAFTFPEGGLTALLAARPGSRFRLEAELEDSSAGQSAEPVGEGAGKNRTRYEVEIALDPSSGVLTVEDEFLARSNRNGKPLGYPLIEADSTDRKIHVRRGGKTGRRRLSLPLEQTLLSNRKYSGKAYQYLRDTRAELASFHSHYLDPRVAMRASQGIEAVDNIGPLGEHMAPFLYRLRARKPAHFAAVRRTICALIPSIDDLAIDLDPRRGVLDVQIRQHGIAYSSRVVSEGTLRVLALLCVAVNPWGGSLVAFEEPENGVHPRRIERIAEVLGSFAFAPKAQRQWVLTTHSPIFCGAVARLAREHSDGVRMYRVTREGPNTRFHRFDPAGPLFTDDQVVKELTPTEDSRFQELLLRGLLDD